jgi:hypothetical protein
MRRSLGRWMGEESEERNTKSERRKGAARQSRNPERSADVLPRSKLRIQEACSTFFKALGRQTLLRVRTPVRTPAFRGQ